MINCLIFILFSYPEIKTEGIELHYSLWEQKTEYVTYEPIFVRISVVNNSSEKVYILPISTIIYTRIFITHDNYDDLPVTFKMDITWGGFPLSPDEKKWRGFFQPLEKGDSIYEYIYINKDWEYKRLPDTNHQYYLEIVRHGYTGGLEKCPFSPVAGRIEKNPHIKFFSISPPQHAEEYRIITTIMDRIPYPPRKSSTKKTWEEKTEAYNKLLKKYPDSPYIPFAMSIMEKKKFLEAYPNNPLVYDIISKVSRISVQGLKIAPWIKNKAEYKRDYRESFGDFDREKCLEYFNSILGNEKYKGTLLEDAILLNIESVKKE
jgi:hypothetical protein